MASFTPQEIEQFLQEFFGVVGARQYTGARYVPIFGRKGEQSIGWDDSAPYEPLTVVLYKGNSYTSRQYVPSGVDILDSEYWAQTGSYNAQVEYYANAVRAVEAGIADANGQIAEVKAVLPFASFDEDDTVRDYVDSEVETLHGVIDASKVTRPAEDGTPGQVLGLDGDLRTQWQDPVVPDAAMTEAAVSDWLDDHPEATTTVLDGAVTTPKLADNAVTAPKLDVYVRQSVDGALTWGTRPTKANVSYSLVQGYWESFSNFAALSTMVTTNVMVHVPMGYELHFTLNDKYVKLNGYDATGHATPPPTTLNRSTYTNMNYTLVSSSDEVVVTPSGKDLYIGFGICANAAHSVDILPADVSLEMWLENPIENLVAPMPAASIATMLASTSSVSPTGTDNDYVLGPSGNGSTDSTQSHKMLRYALTPGRTYVVTMVEPDGTFMAGALKAANSGSSVTTVGPCFEHGGTYLVSATTLADTLFLTVPKSSSDVYVRLVSAPSATMGLNAIFWGMWFAYVDGTRTLHVRGLPNSYYCYHGSFYQTDGSDNTFALQPNKVYAVILNASGVQCVDSPQVSGGDYVVATVYSNNYEVLSQNVNLIANEIPLGPMYKRNTVPIFINNDKLTGYEIFPQGNYRNYGRFFEFGDTYNAASARVKFGSNAYGLASSLTFRQNTTSLDNKKVLCIGDSFTARGWYQERLQSYNQTIEFIGTRQSQYNTIMGEGYSGCRANQVLVTPTITPYGQQAVTNPFYDPILERCTLEYYCRTQSVSPDIVVLAFGLNEENMPQYYSAMQNFIDTCVSYNPDIKVYVMQMPLMVTEIGSLVNSTAAQIRAQRLCWQAAQHMTNATPIPCRFIMVDDLDYNLTETAYPYGGKTVTVASDGVHPNDVTGFYKLGDMLFNYLGM